ncbi:MAG: tyrosine recombinase XerC [Clostridia bacterium]|nr:tyrosine recombinase XerC [Clostridia bacterium]
MLKKNNSKFSDVPDILRNYLNFMLVIKGRSENTVKEYYYDLKTFFKYLQAVTNDLDILNLENVSLDNFDENILKEVTLNDLYEFMTYINNFKSSNDSYKARKVASLRSFYNYLNVKIGFMETNPAVNLDTPKLKKRLPRFLTLEESIALLKSIDGKHKERDIAIFVLFLNCGLRLSELVGINISNINFSKKTLRVIGKGNKERFVYLNDLCISAINSYLVVRPGDNILYDDRDALFISDKNRRISNRMVELLAKKYFKAAGIDETRYSPHKLRHTAATVMYKEGNVDIKTLQEILGHVSISTTQIYTHINDSDMKKAADNNPFNAIKLDE